MCIKSGLNLYEIMEKDMRKFFIKNDIFYVCDGLSAFLAYLFDMADCGADNMIM